ncbi:putative serine/threonine protein kinase [Blattamonas nauphoetae]|uniref:non-specific serine/threonine protein kinase n=1 Tax=Blattamonas nauphoetae TaxID=2049346 RepID=A0ABQ9Y7E2_9EUKA|nr:putative serine/threonine protein kinase [Blattamonas nauphoetae]
MSGSVSAPPGYGLVRHINDGGFGTVIEVSENTTGEHFAVKMMRCMSRKDEERIGREVQRLRTFGHPNIVGLKEVVKMENMQAIVMELGGQSLAQVVKSHSERGVLIDRHIVYQVMVDISSALCFMHNHPDGRTAHGDVKLENILLFGDGHAKLCDLGAAESEDVSSTRGVMSMQYVSPERMDDAEGRASGSSDVWALGIVLHFLLFGKGLFSGQTMIKLAREIGSFQPSQIGTSCGEKERELLIRMLDPDCGSRLTSKQLVESSILRCLINTTQAGWKLSEMKSRRPDPKVAELQNQLKKKEDENIQLRNQLSKEQADKLKEWDRSYNLQSQLITERTIRQKEQESLTKERGRSYQLLEELLQVRMEREEVEQELFELLRMLVEREQLSQPKMKDGNDYGRMRTEQPIVRRRPERATERVLIRKFGTDAILSFPTDGYLNSGSAFTRTGGSFPTLLSFWIGKVVARFTFTFTRITGWTAIGIVDSFQTETVKKGQYFTTVLGGAGWVVSEKHISARQHGKEYSSGTACAAGWNGQRVVLEADGRDGKRTLRLSQAGWTQPTFFSNIPVPFRFAMILHGLFDAVSIEYVEELEEPALTWGTTEIRMDE